MCAQVDATGRGHKVGERGRKLKLKRLYLAVLSSPFSSVFISLRFTLCYLHPRFFPYCYSLSLLPILFIFSLLLFSPSFPNCYSLRIFFLVILTAFPSFYFHRHPLIVILFVFPSLLLSVFPFLVIHTVFPSFLFYFFFFLFSPSFPNC